MRKFRKIYRADKKLSGKSSDGNQLEKFYQLNFDHLLFKIPKEPLHHSPILLTNLILKDCLNLTTLIAKSMALVIDSNVSMIASRLGTMIDLDVFHSNTVFILINLITIWKMKFFVIIHFWII